MLAATALQAHFRFDGVATIGSAFGGIPHSFPGFHLPTITAARLIQLAGPAFAIAGLGAIESLLSATVADGMAGTKHNSNQELIGQGLANIISPLFGGFTATGAIARTATNIRTGGNSPLAGVIHSVVLALIVFFLSPLAASIPLCALAAILFVVAYNMSELHRFGGMCLSAPRNDVIVLLVTFFLTVFVDLVVAVNVGVILAALMFLQRMSASVRIDRHTSQSLSRDIGPGVMVYTIEGPIFFGAVETFENDAGRYPRGPQSSGAVFQGCALHRHHRHPDSGRSYKPVQPSPCAGRPLRDEYARAGEAAARRNYPGGGRGEYFQCFGKGAGCHTTVVKIPRQWKLTAFYMVFIYCVILLLMQYAKHHPLP